MLRGHLWAPKLLNIKCLNNLLTLRIGNNRNKSVGRVLLVFLVSILSFPAASLPLTQLAKEFIAEPLIPFETKSCLDFAIQFRHAVDNTHAAETTMLARPVQELARYVSNWRASATYVAKVLDKELRHSFSTNGQRRALCITNALLPYIQTESGSKNSAIQLFKRMLSHSKFPEVRYLAASLLEQQVLMKFGDQSPQQDSEASAFFRDAEFFTQAFLLERDEPVRAVLWNILQYYNPSASVTSFKFLKIKTLRFIQRCEMLIHF